ncbi:hypothetical protein ACH4OV_27540 [Streptomyces diastaticus]|uniref:hypothetical protein n=1 Tax=Streptomyces diastaticus TaxID=1956 RepID=UPI0037A6C2D3
MTHTAAPIDADKSPLTAIDAEILDLAAVLQAHPGITEALPLSENGDVRITTATLGTWTLDIQQNEDGDFLQATETVPAASPAPTGPAGPVVQDVILPALLGHSGYLAVSPDTTSGTARLTVYRADRQHWTGTLTSTA